MTIKKIRKLFKIHNSGEITPKGEVLLKKRSYYSISHVQAAALFARLSGNVEKDYNGEFSDELFAEHRAYVTGSIFAAVSFLEATINELFADSADKVERVIPLGFDVIEHLADRWKREEWEPAERYTILKKFHTALIVAGMQPFNKGARPHQDVSALIGLRNALVHYKPDWVTAGVETEQQALSRLEKTLWKKFPFNPLTGEGNPFFPDKCLGQGCTRWAVASSVRFVDEFFLKMGLPSPLDHVRDRLDTK